MPTYSYQCMDCGNVTDVYHGMSATPKVVCEACGGATRRLLGSGAGLIFKGSGFYETDYKRSNGNGKQGAKESASADGASKSSGEGAKAESASSSAENASSGGDASATSSKSSSGSGKAA